MPRAKHILTVAMGDPLESVAFLAARLGMERALAARWLEQGAVEIGGKRLRSGEELSGGAKVIVRPPRPQTAAALVEVYRDEDILVVDKPAGMLTQPAPGEDASSLQALLTRRNPAGRIMHRLDREASGLVLISLEVRGRTALQAALLNGEIHRSYVVLASGRIGEAREIRLRMARDAQDSRRRIALPESAPAGKAACTRITPLGAAHDRDATWLRVDLLSGRTHQIRVHLAALGHPLCGDTLYGGPPATRLMLHAAVLHFIHPISGATLDVRAALPNEFDVNIV